MKYSKLSRALLLSSIMVGSSSMAWSQSDTSDDDEIIAVGTQIKGSDIAGILPVTSLDAIDIETTGAVSGDELLASIPQIGDVTFRAGRIPVVAKRPFRMSPKKNTSAPLFVRPES